MSIYAAVIGTSAGICIGFALLYLMFGLRRHQDKRLYLTFSLFSFAYAGTLLLGIWYRGQESVLTFLTISRWDGIFIAIAIISLNWYVAAYTKVAAQRYLWLSTAVIVLATIGAALTPTLIFAEMPTLTTIPLPWNERVYNLSGEENIWGILLLLAQFITLVFIVTAGVRQFLGGERQTALVLLGGMAWFIIALSYELLAAAGLWTYVPFAETGFLGIAIALSLQMAKSTIEMEEALAVSKENLEKLVADRTIKLGEAQKQLIGQAQESAVFEERNRIARDLHDAVTQTIYSASLISEVLPQVWARSPDEGARNLTKLRQLVRGALAELRTLLFELRPSALENAELEILLTQLADAFTGRTRIPVETMASGQNHLPQEVKTTYYRITQEALNNIAKHASASAVILNLEQRAEEVSLVISDDGVGFDQANTPVEGMGLTIMRERSEAIAAQLNLISQPGRGTRLFVDWQAQGNKRKGEGL